MPKSLFISLIFVLFIIGSFKALSQNEKYTEDFIYKDKLYKTGSWWISGSTGLGYFGKRNIQQKNFAVGITGRYKQHYLTVGYHFSGDNSIIRRSGQRLNDIYFGYGLRHETLKHNVHVYAGPGYAFGYVYDHFFISNSRSRGMANIITSESLNSFAGTKFSANTINYYKGFRTIGLYAKVEYIQKIFYDIGIGAAAYASVNKYYQVVGVQVSVYFSTAFIADI